MRPLPLRAGPLLRRKFEITFIGLMLALSGCVSAPPTYKTTADARSRVAAAKHIVVVHPDVEVREISAGGIAEKRDEWAEAAAANLLAVVTTKTGFAPAPTLDATAQAELLDTQALIRAIVQNHLAFLFAPDSLSARTKPLNYQVGRIDRIADACGADAMLFIVARDSQVTGGRRALQILGFALPTGAFASAVLVERDGTVLWFNHYYAERINLRDTDDTTALVHALLAGLPRP